LKKLPVDEIKVDKSFVIDMLEDKKDEMIVRTVINLAHNLGLRVVAEGIETKEVWDKLASFKCNTAQGYYLSAPVPAESLFIWCAERKGIFEVYK
jgi:EAL domain-containing protein (putative c-di-GMP-specific phosphodiesterase class I)